MRGQTDGGGRDRSQRLGAAAAVDGSAGRRRRRDGRPAIATLWYGQYRPSTGVLSYASGGHPPPVLTCHGEPSRLLEPAASPPLGVGGSGHMVAEHCEHLPAGAVLVAYSDGLVERRGTDIDAQIELLRDIVTGACDPARDAGADEIAAEIVSTLVPVPGCAEDDVCLLVVRRKAG